MSTKPQFVGGMAVSFLVLATWNVVDFLIPPVCYDCHFHRGKPLALFQEGGYVGDSGILWWGLLSDVLMMVFLGLVIGVLWSRRREQLYGESN
jgi:hypothetical protein